MGLNLNRRAVGCVDGIDVAAGIDRHAGGRGEAAAHGRDATRGSGRWEAFSYTAALL